MKRPDVRHVFLLGLAASVALVGAAVAPASSVPDPGDPVSTLDLVFLMDGSGSIDANDWTLQKQGYAAALADQENFPLDGTVAVSVIQWSSNGWDETTRTEVPLTKLDDQADVTTLTDAILGIQQLGNSTNPGDAVRAGTDQLLASGRPGSDWVLCMSTDGEENSGEYLPAAVAYAEGAGVDKFSVVAIEDPPYFDAVAAERAYGPNVFGGGTVTVSRTTTEFTSLIGGCANDAMRVRAVEVNQALQDWDNNHPLIEAKRTVVRAFVETPDGSTARVNGRLRGVRDGVELPGSPLTAINGENGVVVDGYAVDERSDLDRSLNFVLPGEWTRHTGVGIELTLELPGGAACVDETGATITCGTFVYFQESTWAGDFSYRAITWPGSPDTDFSALDEQHQRVVAQFPTVGWSAGFTELEVDERPGGSSDDLADVNEALNTAREIEGSPDGNRWYGVIHGTDGGGLASGRVSSGWDGNLTEADDAGYARNRVVHEIGHSLGMHHSVNADQNGYDEFLWWDTAKRGWCGEVADTDAPEWPNWIDVGSDRRAAIGPVGEEQTEVWGLDTRLVSDAPALAVVEPQATFALMSYCVGTGQSRWIGLPDYEHLLYEDRSPINDGDRDEAAGSGLALRGTLRADGAIGGFAPALLVDRAPTVADPAGSHVLDLLDGSGSVVYSVRFNPVHSDQDTVPGLPVTAASDSVFNVVVPAGLGGVARATITQDGSQVASVQSSPAVPTLSLTDRPGGDAANVTFAWSTQDADGPAPRSTVLYSPDDGAHWQVVGIDLTGQSVTASRRGLPGGTRARFRVISSDGLNAVTQTSAPFSLPDLAPLATITSPSDETTVVGAQTVAFNGRGQDVEDGTLGEASLRWTSSLDGDLGTGTLITRRADTLTAGTHTITLTVTDSAGNTATSTVQLTVTRVGTPPPNPGGDVTFGGFTEPVAGGLARANAGSTIPVKWSLSGPDAAEASAVLSARFLADGATYAIVRSGLNWHLNVNTPKAWAGTTQTFRVALVHGTVHDVEVEFR